MAVKMKALQSFSGPDGKHAQGDVFDAADDRVKFLTDGGYAERATRDDAQPEAPEDSDTATRAAAPRASKTAKATKA